MIDVSARRQVEESHTASEAGCAIDTAAAHLELAKVLEVSRAASGDLAMDRLVEAVLRAALEHAGAERAVLGVRSGELRLQAEANATDQGEVIVTHRDRPFRDCADLPCLVVQHAARTQQTLLLEDATASGAFAADPYMRQRRPRSLLCLPLIKNHSLVAVLYLDHTRASGVFTAPRIALLQVLASVAAVALDNSRLYRELQEREAKIRRLALANILGVVVGTFDGRILEANDAFLRMVDYTREDVAAGRLRWQDLTPPEWRDGSGRALDQLRATGACELFEKEYYRRDGTRVPVLVAAVTADSAPADAVTFVLDQTERKRAEEGRRRSEAYLAEAQRLSHAGSFAFDVPASRYVYWSDEMFRIYGFDPREGPPDRDAFEQRIVAADREHIVRAAWDSLMNGRDSAIEFGIALPNGTPKHIRAIGHAVVDATGTVREVVGTHIDVSEQKRAEEERERLGQLEADLSHVNRVSMMGELAASLAHEIKQPLTAAVVNAQASQRWLDRPAPDMARASRAAQSMVRDVMQAAEIIDGVRALSGQGAPQRDRIQLNALIHEMVVVLRNRAERQNVVMRTALDPMLPMVTADRVQLQQVLMNLMVNAIEAMQATGGELLVSSSRNADGSVLVAVRDDGVGLPADGTERLFVAFVTTKPKGTGLGLSISRRIIEAHNGRLWATANVERGATFQFVLPGEDERDGRD